MSKRSARLSLEILDDRAIPAAGPWLAEAFDTAALGLLPSQWLSWTTEPTSGFRVAAGPAISGRSIASDGGSTLTSRTWTPSIYSANVTVSAAILADSLVPAQLFARGQRLDTSTPSYYAVSVVRGTEVKLLSARDGVQTELGSVRTLTYVSGLWLNVTLTTQRNVIQARVQRRDTGDWLNPFGEWQSSPVAALTAIDDRIKSSGHVGLARSAVHAGTIYLDDLRVGPAIDDVIPPTVSAGVRQGSRAEARTSFGGVVRLVARIGRGGPVRQVDYLMDGELVARLTDHKSGFHFDTRQLSNGPHTLMVRAWDPAGNVGSAQKSFVVANQVASSTLSIPRHYKHIRYASLAYNGLSIGATEKKLLQQSVDLVVPNPRYLATIDAVTSSTPQLIYSNVSNLYFDLLTGWLDYADRNGISREGAFYHVARATPFSGDSPSSMPVNAFWNVQRGPLAGTAGFVNVTGQSRSPAVGDVAFPGTGSAVYIGYPERYREINLSLSRGAAAGWQGAIEYPIRVDSAGRPTAWRALSVKSDTTSGLRNSGTLTFDPPADWQPAVIPGSTARLFYARISTVSGNANSSPIASAILGRDYVGAKGARAGTIPAFDAEADANRDGYLGDAEYARRRPGFDARFTYESRLFYPNYGQMRFATNPQGRGVAEWAVAYCRQLLANNPLADGIFMDNSGGQLRVDSSATVESTDAYASGYASLLGAIDRGISPKWVLANTSSGGTAADRVARQAPATIEEFALRPLSQSWAQVRDIADLVARRLSTADSSGYLILDSLSTGGSPIDPRTRIAALAYYYLLADPNKTFFMTWGGEEPASAWSRHWFDAIAFDVGKPRGSWTVFATGNDPASANLSYQIFQRTYDNALVLFKPLSYASGKGSGTIGDATATTHLLNGNYRPLNADGTLGPPTSSVTLRNGEGAILIRA